MTAVPAISDETLLAAIDVRTADILRARRAAPTLKRRGWLVRRMLLLADVVGLVLAYLLAEVVASGWPPAARVVPYGEWLVLIPMVPLWILVAKVYGLYERDEERAGHSTVDDLVGVFHLVTVGVWLLFIAGWITAAAEPNVPELVAFWTFAIALITTGRAFARTACRRNISYLQNTVIVGAGDVGQLVARKLLQHPEYGINLVGFIDDEPRELRNEVEHIALLGSTDGLADIARLLDVERVIFAFSNESEGRLVDLVRELRVLDIQIDVVPRLFDVMGPRAAFHTIEALPVVGLAPMRLSRSSRVVKRLVDVAGASLGLLLTAPVFAVLALLISRDSDGPVLFRQERLGEGMKSFTTLKFRTMRTDIDQSLHRDYILATMTAAASVGRNGIYKLTRDDAVTRVGRWLRKTSLDELPQLINVLRGDMSLVGPRPCIPYETEHFEAYHYERFLVPAGLTGLWQVTARARATFGEALDMDVAYVRGWSLGLDLRLLLRTPVELLRQKSTA